MSDYNILILSAGRRVELVNLFKKASMDLKINSKVIAADCSETAPALYFADKKVTLPRIDNPEYIDKIIEISKKEQIKLIVPTIDTDLLLLSKNQDYIYKNSGAKVLISSEDVISICRDKIKTQYYLEKNGFKVPTLYNKDSQIIVFPVFIKPVDGSSSINAFKVNSIDELNNYSQIIKNPMIQEFIKGDEYTVDVFLDFNSNVITIVPRLRMAVRGGEISKGKIIKNKTVIDEVMQLMKTLKPIGHITVQLMVTKEGIKFIEINPRFGGGAPMSIQSGANSCINLYKLLMNEKLTYNDDYEEDLVFLRYDRSICLKDGIIQNDKSNNI
ncbi:ATP-grasp domain-containing protein [Mariniplasma anaerobium]|uniref:Carbamoyl phosphate synthase n=1 Tax=Mariniplasma anaerobium TaxID=2735436 RepID=A0A7U9TI14_9MOLU|nr:ATP-grasp domain-containing protein [Mariniplasma anaerobium]BCR36104.1 carbamoyl phosphate synthase [Mariniplasma anaerobium]